MAKDLKRDDHKVRVFISFSKDRSRMLASALKECLGTIFEEIDIFLANEDIKSGSRWEITIADELSARNYGILCVTPENKDSPWIMFEAGALSKFKDLSKVVPYRFEIEATELVSPLGQFQGPPVDEAGTWKLIGEINELFPSPIRIDRLKILFKASWSKMAEDIGKIPSSEVPVKARPQVEMVEEILNLTRSIEKNLQDGRDGVIGDEEIFVNAVEDLIRVGKDVYIKLVNNDRLPAFMEGRTQAFLNVLLALGDCPATNPYEIIRPTIVSGVAKKILSTWASYYASKFVT